MKRFALVAATLAVTACSKSENTPANDTTTPAMAPAPADTGMKMMDSMRMADSIRMADSMKMVNSKTKSGTKRP